MVVVGEVVIGIEMAIVEVEVAKELVGTRSQSFGTAIRVMVVLVFRRNRTKRHYCFEPEFVLGLAKGRPNVITLRVMIAG